MGPCRRPGAPGPGCPAAAPCQGAARAPRRADDIYVRPCPRAGVNAKILVAAAVIGLAATIAAVGLYGQQAAPQGSPAAAPRPADGLEITLESIAPRPPTPRALTVDISFGAANPGPTTALLQYLSYSVMADGRRVHAGIIGERPEGFVASSNFVTLIGGGSATLSDSFSVRNTGADPEFWEALASGGVEWTVRAEASHSRSSMVAGGERLEVFEFGPIVSQN